MLVMVLGLVGSPSVTFPGDDNVSPDWAPLVPDGVIVRVPVTFKLMTWLPHATLEPTELIT